MIANLPTAMLECVLQAPLRLSGPMDLVWVLVPLTSVALSFWDIPLSYCLSPFLSPRFIRSFVALSLFFLCALT